MTLTHGTRDPLAARNSASPTRLPPLVAVIWALLVVNTLGSGGDATIIPLPRRIAQLITMGSLGVAFALALLLNPRLRVRPSVVLLLLTLLVVVSFVSSSSMEYGVTALVRCVRLAVFVATLWLLTPWWDRTLAWVRHHIRVLGAVLLSVVIGLVLAPDLALETHDGRLSGAIWYLTPTNVAQYAAVVAGLTIILWLARCVTGWSALGIAGPAIVMLEMAYTRTATIALVAALAVAGLSLALTTARARAVLAVAVPCAVLIAVTFQAALLGWFRRGQGDDALETLTGRQEVWDALLAAERSPSETWLGVGLTGKAFNGQPIDSGWLAVYHDQGMVGVAIVAAFFLILVIAAVARPPSAASACAIFLIVYCLTAAYTTVGPGFASTYQLHLIIAAALLTRGSSVVTTPTTPTRAPA